MQKTRVIFVILGIVLIFTGCGRDDSQSNHLERIPVKLAPVVEKEISVPVHVSGRLYPGAQVKLSFKIGGLIDTLSADDGSTVEKGQVLASLNLAEVDARVNQAQKAYEKAERDFERVSNLYRDRAATLEQFQNVKTALELAESDLNIARFNRKHSVIRAPSRGKILKTMAEVNEMIAPGYPVFIFGSTQKNWVIRAGLSQTDVVRIGLNDQAQIEFDSYPDKTFTGRVSTISQAVDPRSGTYEIEVEMQGEGLKLVAGFIGQMDIFPMQKQLYTLVTLDALVDSEGNLAYVYTVEKNRAVKRQVRIGHLFEDSVAVESGLEGIKRVVVVGAAYLDDGSAVTIVQ